MELLSVGHPSSPLATSPLWDEDLGSPGSNLKGFPSAAILDGPCCASPVLTNKGEPRLILEATHQYNLADHV